MNEIPYLHCPARILDLEQHGRGNRLARIHPAALSFGCISFHDCLVSCSEETSRLIERRKDHVET